MATTSGALGYRSATAGRLLLLSQREQVDLHASSDPYPVWRQVAEFTPDGTTSSTCRRDRAAGQSRSPGGRRPET